MAVAPSEIIGGWGEISLQRDTKKNSTNVYGIKAIVGAMMYLVTHS
jgi:hypothetical protein